MIEIHPLREICEVRPRDDLAAILFHALESADISPRANDILVVTQKIISKSEDRFVDLASIRPGAEAKKLAELVHKDPRFVEVVLSESVAVVRAVPNVLITRHRNGFVMANAGVDRSNIGPVDGEMVLLLPLDPDASAALLHERFHTRFGAAPGIVISDSFGRPWRYGVVNVALGASGVPSLIDKRGQPDRDRRPLEVTQIAFADMAATAAGLATGEGNESVPAALIRGLSWSAADAKASALIRPLSEDLFQ